MYLGATKLGMATGSRVWVWIWIWADPYLTRLTRLWTCTGWVGFHTDSFSLF